MMARGSRHKPSSSVPRAALACWLAALLAGVPHGGPLRADAQSPPPACPPLRVLALGDSLTNGAVPSLQLNHPYTQRLGELLQAQLQGRAIDFKTVAVNGAGLIMPAPGPDGRNTTLPPLLASALAGGQRYDIILLMAGINDLGRGNKSADLVFDQLAALVNTTAASIDRAVVLVAPWPNRFVARTSDNEAQRLRLIGMLQQSFEAAGGGGGGSTTGSSSSSSSLPRLVLDRIDTDGFAFWDMPPAQRQQLQDDELHLTARGYDELGAHIFKSIAAAGLLPLLQCGVPAGPSNQTVPPPQLLKPVAPATAAPALQPGGVSTPATLTSGLPAVQAPRASAAAASAPAAGTTPGNSAARVAVGRGALLLLGAALVLPR